MKNLAKLAKTPSQHGGQHRPRKPTTGALVLVAFLVLMSVVGAHYSQASATAIFNVWLPSSPSGSEQLCSPGQLCAEWLDLNGSIARCCIPDAALGTSDVDAWVSCIETPPSRDIIK